MTQKGIITIIRIMNIKKDNVTIKRFYFGA